MATRSTIAIENTDSRYMTTAWNHLPNAAHIDRILADLNANPDNWDRARDPAWDRAWDRVWDAALDAAWNAVGDAARTAAWAAARSAAWGRASYAILALIAWPEAGNYLDLSIESLQVLAALGDHKAVLMLPAVIAFESEKELV